MTLPITRPPDRLRVLQSFPSGSVETNPYLTQLAASILPYADVFTFSWKTALTGDYSVLHLHWPEVALRGRTPLGTQARRVLFLLLMIRIRLKHIALVRTLHNVRSHETGSWLEERLLSLCDRTTTAWIRLNPFTPVPPRAAVYTIGHGDYADWASRHPVPEAIPGRFAAFGRIRPYKGIEQLLVAFGTLPETDLSLRVVGEPLNRALGDAIAGLAGHDERVGLTMRYVEDEVLAREVGEAELVVLPYLDMHNSGALLLALSLSRPVLVPSNPVTEALRIEVGNHWVHTYEGVLEPGALVTALEQARHKPPNALPDLSRRGWNHIGVLHRNAYLAAVHAARPRKRPWRT